MSMSFLGLSDLCQYRHVAKGLGSMAPAVKAACKESTHMHTHVQPQAHGYMSKVQHVVKGLGSMAPAVKAACKESTHTHTYTYTCPNTCTRLYDYCAARGKGLTLSAWHQLLGRS